MYLTSDERARLGLSGWGSDVPEHVVAEARAAAERGGGPPAAEGATEEMALELSAVGDETVEPPAPVMTEPVSAPSRRRRRRGDGKFEADDPATSTINEAWEGPEPIETLLTDIAEIEAMAAEQQREQEEGGAAEAMAEIEAMAAEAAMAAQGG